MDIPNEISIEKAKILKLKVQERVMTLWKENSQRLNKALDMDILLQILACFAADELFFEEGIEIE